MTVERNSIYRFDGFTLEPSEYRLWRNEREIHLSPKTFETLRYLVERHGRLAKKSELLDALWADTVVTEHALTRCIKEAREALDDDAFNPQYIKTVPRLGYKFIAPVKEIAAWEGKRNGNDSLPLEFGDLQGQGIDRPTEQDSIKKNESPYYDARPLPVEPSEIKPDPAMSAPVANLSSGMFGLSGWRRIFILCAACFIFGAVAAGMAVWKLTDTPSSSTRTSVRFTVALSVNAPLALGGNPLALSRDGSYQVYSAERDGAYILYLRSMNQFEATPIAGTIGANNPFFSPDGQWIGYFDYRESKLKKIPVKGGAPVTIAEAPRGLGASWGADGSIIYTPDIGLGLWRVSADGGTPQILTEPDYRKAELTHRWPEILPGGKAVIFTSSNGGIFDNASIVALSLRTGLKSGHIW